MMLPNLWRRLAHRPASLSRRRPTRWTPGFVYLESRDLPSLTPPAAVGVGALPAAVVAADFNGDGKLDLATANSASGSVSVLAGNGDGTFQSAATYGTGFGPAALAVGDFNGDGKPDLAVVNNGANNVSILMNTGKGTFAAAVNYAVDVRPVSVGVGDFNGDGKADLVVADAGSGDISVVENKGDGTFFAATNLAAGPLPGGVAVGDVNGDTKPDVAVTTATGVSVFLDGPNGSLGTPATYADGAQPVAVTIGDFTGDGKADLVLANAAGNNITLLPNSGTGTFQAGSTFAAGTQPAAVVAADFDGDGKLDVAVANGGSNDVSMLMGTGKGSFTAAAPYAAGVKPTGIAAGDFNGNTAPDVIVTNAYTASASVEINQPPATHLGFGTTSTSTVAGTSYTVAVSALDNFGNADPTYTGTLHITSSDTQATLPPDYKFASTDHGVHTFTVALRSAGTQTLTLTDGTFGGQVGVTVNPGTASTLLVAAPSGPATAGAAADFTVTAKDAFGNVATGYTGIVHVTSSDPQAAPPADYTFGSSDHGVHTFGVTLKTAGSQSVSFGDGKLSGQGTVTVNPAAAGALAVSGIGGTIGAGAPAMFTVTAKDAFGNVATGYGGTLHFTSSDKAATLPADYTFTAADHGTHTFSLYLRTAGSQTFGLSDGTMSGQGTITVTPGGTESLSVTGPGSATAGVAFTVTVTAKDLFANVATGYTGTVHFMSSDPGATLPANYTFTAADQGTHTFSVTLRAGGAEAIAVIDSAIGSITGQASVSVQKTEVFATAPDAGSPPEVRVFDAKTGAQRLDFMAYDTAWLGGVRIAVGDVNGDGTPDIVATPGPGGGPDVRIFDGKSGAILTEFMAYDPHFLGGLYVASGDVNGDGYADIITGADAGGGPEVKVFSGKDGSVLFDFYAYGAGFPGGVRVAAGDVNGDGKADIITGAGPGGGPHVEVFSGADGSLLRSFMAYSTAFGNGIYVASGDVNGDGKADIITGAGAGGGPHVQAFSGTDLSVLESFYAYAPGFTGGVRVGAVDFNGDGKADIVTAPGISGGPDVEVFNGTNLTSLDSMFAYNPTFTGGVFVGGN